MPILSGAINLVRFRVIDGPVDPKAGTRQIAQGLQQCAFEPIDQDKGEVDRSVGWVELYDTDSTQLKPKDVLLGEDVILCWRVDQVRVPPAVLRSALEEWQYSFEQNKQRKPTKREKTEEKEVILRNLRKKAFLTSQLYDVRWCIPTQELQIWATSTKIIDEIVIALEESLGLIMKPLGPGARWELSELKDIAPTPELFGREALSGREL